MIGYLDRSDPLGEICAIMREHARLFIGFQGGTQRVALPEGFLDALGDDTPPGPGAEDPTSGG